MKKFFEEPAIDVLKIVTSEATMADEDGTVGGLPSIGDEGVYEEFPW